MDSLKKKISMLGIVALIIVVTATLVACSSAPPATSQITALPTTSAATTSQIKTPPTTSTTTTSNQTSGGALSDMLGRVSGIASMKYDMVTTTSNLTTTATMWAKKSKIRMETTQQGQNTVILMNGDTKTMYMYTPAQNMAIKMDFSQAPKSATDNSNSILQYAPTVVGTETLDGKVCQIIQYIANGATTKSWIWIEKGLPVRVQASTSQGTSTTDFKNYDFSDIPDSLFDLPAGVQMTTLGMPSGLPTNMPTGYPTNLPSGR